MNTALIMLYSVVLLCMFPGVFSWGFLGHELVGGLAQEYLSTTASGFVVDLLTDFHGSMEKAGPWADEIKYHEGWGWSSELHYVDSAKDWECTYVPKEHTDGKDVVGAISNYTSRLVKLSDKDEQNIALKFIIHFVGDIHQPLHVGFVSDLGGNEITGTFYNYSDNLHAMWDTYIMSDIVDRDFDGDDVKFKAYLLDQMQTTFSRKVKTWLKEGSSEPSTWAAETAKLACDYAYVDSNGKHIKDGFSLADDYYDFTKPVVKQQLMKAAARLAGLINAIVERKGVTK